ncbi:tRNA uridine-5-carboxymethylaminomethyl(34) synthesis GTPase MnmE [Desulforudis sp. 1088]|uniref:tRNA uridine-5-carboxymethylaminomethyl(34) synthesis GTPase MnmE n=2 Tax=unclassified Candidatus Desulforudis TaxID=2635950 RepID=UPI003CF1C17E
MPGVLFDTIAAIATCPGEGAVGIVRLSGTEALRIVSRVFRPVRAAKWPPASGFRMTYGHVVDPETGDVVDEVLVSVMKAPRSYTREDVVEVNCHGGPLPLRRILELILENGARLAEPGEFTKRAFLNGRLDLAQAEAVLDVIRAKTGDGLSLAVGQLGGRLSERIRDMLDAVMQVLAFVEASIDFPEDDIPELRLRELAGRLEELAARCASLAEGAEAGKVFREGISTVIVGKPNVGKSSLLNALLREKRAIVTAVPGTTRDVIEEIVNVRGMPLRLIDTAGLRYTDDVVERIGVQMARERAETAELVLFVLDAGSGLEEEDIEVARLVERKRGILIINKVDVGERELDLAALPLRVRAWPAVRTVMTEGLGLEELESVIEEQVLGKGFAMREPPLVTNVRHKASLERAAGYLSQAAANLAAGVPLDIVAVDIRAGAEALGEVIGANVAEDVLDRIFADFCIGK